MKRFTSYTLRVWHALLSLPVTLACLGNAYAAPTIDNSATGIGTGFNNFVNKVDALIVKAINAPDFVDYVDFLFLVLTVNLIVFLIIRWVNRAAGTYDFIAAGVLIIIVKWLMMTYDTATTAIWSVGEGVGTSLQTAMLGTGDLFFAPRFLAKVLQSITWVKTLTTDPFAIIEIALNMFVLSLTMMALSMLAFVSAIWGFWGYGLAKLIGMLFVPTLLNERISFLFDGWLRFFLGFVVYALIARLNLVLVACAVAMFLGLGLPPTETSVATALPAVSSLFEMLGLMTFMFVGILALFSTGRFAATIISGSGGGGMGSAVLGAARTAARFAAG